MSVSCKPNRLTRSHAPAWERIPGRSGVPSIAAPSISRPARFSAGDRIRKRSRKQGASRSHAPAWEHIPGRSGVPSIAAPSLSRPARFSTGERIRKRSRKPGSPGTGRGSVLRPFPRRSAGTSRPPCCLQGGIGALPQPSGSTASLETKDDKRFGLAARTRSAATSVSTSIAEVRASDNERKPVKATPSKTNPNTNKSMTMNEHPKRHNRPKIARVLFLLAAAFFSSLSPAPAKAADITVAIVDDAGSPIAGTRVYAFTESGVYTGKNATTDASGTALLGADSDFDPGAYQFRADYLGHQFWSDPVALPDNPETTIAIPVETAQVSVVSASQPAAGVKVYLFSDSGTYLNQSQTTDQDGLAVFELPVGVAFKFRADILGGQYWSDPVAIAEGQTNNITLDAGGGTLQVDLRMDESTPLAGVKTHLFSESGTYLNRSATSDASGLLSFQVPEANYKIRADHFGSQFWSVIATVYADVDLVFEIPHHITAVAVNGVFDQADPAPGVKVYLFSSSGSYLSRNATTDADGLATFLLPEKDFKVRADYFNRQFWSAVFNSGDATDVSIDIPMADAQVTVTGGGAPLPGVSVYVFTPEKSYLSMSAATGDDGAAVFRIPAGDYDFRADHQGSQYWSGATTLAAGQATPVEISTGGGPFTLTVLRGPGDPLTEAPCHVFDENGTYLNMSATTGPDGKAAFDLADGACKFRVDHLGYQFWTDIFQVPATLEETFTIPHYDVQATVNGVFDQNDPLPGVKVNLFSPSGTYLNQNATTDDDGLVSFLLPEQDYKLRVDFFGRQFWSAVFNGGDASGVYIDIPMADARITVTGSGAPVPGIDVYVFTPEKSYLNLSGATGDDGTVVFRIPAGDCEFRADRQGSQYWSGTTTLAAGQSNIVEISTGGGGFVLTVLRGPGDPLEGIPCHVFSEGGTYLNMSATTGPDGKVSFDLADGSYKIRADRLGYQFWTDIFQVPATLEETFAIPHHDVQATVSAVFDQSDPIPGVKVHLFSPSGSYLGQNATTDENGLASFLLPEQDYKLRADCFGRQFWSGVFNGGDASGVSIDIPMADARIEVSGAGVPLESVPVHVFSSSDTYLNMEGSTDENGRTTFRLPADGLYRFRATRLGSHYWNNDRPLAAGQIVDLPIDTGGGAFELTVIAGPETPIPGADCHVFSADGVYLGLSDVSGDDGKVSFDLSDGQYKIRIDHMGYSHWAGVYDVPQTLSETFAILKSNKVVYAIGLNPGPQPLPGLKAYLFDEAGAYRNIGETTSEQSGHVLFNLSDDDYKARIDRDGDQHWSDILRPEGNIVAIDLDAGDLLPAVENFSVSDGGLLSWTPLEDRPDAAGYDVYRRHQSEPFFAKTNDATLPADGDSYTDPDAAEPGAYEYFLCAVSTEGVAGYPSLIESFSNPHPENDTPVSDLSAVRENGLATVSWDPVAGHAFMVHRGEGDAEVVAYARAEEPPFVDDSAKYTKTWSYQVQTLKEYADPVRETLVVKAGPLSDPVVLDRLPPATIDISNALQTGDNRYILQVGSSPPYGIEGTYSGMDGAVEVSAKSSDSGASAAGSASEGTFSLSLPEPGTWIVSVSETGGWKSASAALTLDADTEPPVLSVNGPAQRTATADSVVLEGTATDAGSGVASVAVESDRYPGQSFGASLAAAGAFSCEVPLKTGSNILTVSAADFAMNVSTAAVSVAMQPPQVPVISIESPVDGAILTEASTTVSGSVRSSLEPGEIRLSLGDRIDFPSGTGGEYAFSFQDVPLVEGANILTVTAETVFGSASDQVAVTCRESSGDEDDDEAPTIELRSVREENFVSGEYFTVAGTAASDSGVQSVTVDGQSVPLSGPPTLVSFSRDVFFDGRESMPIEVAATDEESRSATVSFSVVRDAEPPTVEFDDPSLQASPAVNAAARTPHELAGTVTEKHLASLAVNGQAVGATPAADPDKWEFSAEIDLVRNVQTPVIVTAVDLAGNRTAVDLILELDAALDIRLLSPEDGAEYLSDGAEFDLEIAVTVPGVAPDDTVSAVLDGSTPVALARSGDYASSAATVAPGDHELVVTVESSEGRLLASASASFSVIDEQSLPVQVERTEPADGATDVEPTVFAAFYFNREIDPDMLEVSVEETVHGESYVSAESGAGIAEFGAVELEEIHRDREPVPGRTVVLPDSLAAAFYPKRDFAYGSEIFVSVVYGGTGIFRSKFSVRPLPTLVQGGVFDQFMRPLEGVEVRLEKAGQSAFTDADGVFGFGFGRPVEDMLPEGRWRAVANPDLQNAKYGSVEAFFAIREGELNDVEPMLLPLLNPEVPFVSLRGGDPGVLLAEGELRLDLSEAEILFPDGTDRGPAHAQFAATEQLPYPFLPEAVPNWAFCIQPGGIRISGDPRVVFALPALAGGYDYVESMGERALIVALDAESLMIVPVGVGRVDRDLRTLESEGAPLELERLDVLGFAPVSDDAQPYLESFANDEIGLGELVGALRSLQQ